ncbi:UNVERIFIED_CONTAM: Ankyrin repeat domain-containing protein 13B [Sesamum calycinum]|uniref:Ankyrin repeat domain-containing protein 13B n=1 Tax=Sesamum calycinum TaxID=2727403 RepID=A0AAW2LSH6_9LAMI
MPIGSIDEKAIDEVMIDLVGSSGEEERNPATFEFAYHHVNESDEERNIREEGEKKVDNRSIGGFVAASGSGGSASVGGGQEGIPFTVTQRESAEKRSESLLISNFSPDCPQFYTSGCLRSGSGNVFPGDVKLRSRVLELLFIGKIELETLDCGRFGGDADRTPQLAKAGEVNTEAESLAAEEDADAVSAVIDRRDVPGRETPLHLAVRLHDAICAEILMAAGADWSLQNENGWSALQEAVCTREENIAMIIARHYQPLAWAKWCRRLPRIVASAARIRDFYMEITFHFESSVIPFIGRIAPSDTYRIWKRGSNLRADMTLAGFDGFRIQRSDQTFLFLGEGHSSEDGNISLPPGSLIVLAHKEKEITNALEGAGVQPSEAEVAHEVALMSQTNMYRPGIDVTQAELVPI